MLSNTPAKLPDRFTLQCLQGYACPGAPNSCHTSAHLPGAAATRAPATVFPGQTPIRQEGGVLTLLRTSFKPHGTTLAAAALVAAVALAIAVAVQAKAGQANSAPAGALASSLKLLYLPDAARPVVEPAQARALGVETPGTVADFLAQAPAADALLLDRARLADLPPGFLAQQYAESKVIVGLNVPSDELERTINFNPVFDLAPFVQDWGGRSFYTLEYRSFRPDRRGVGRQSDLINNAGVLVSRIQRAVPWARGREPATATTAAGTRGPVRKQGWQVGPSPDRTTAVPVR